MFVTQIAHKQSLPMTSYLLLYRGLLLIGLGLCLTACKKKNPVEEVEDVSGFRIGLVAYYPFNGNADDASGNGNNGRVSGATLAPNRFGKSNKAYQFDGSSSKITSTIAAIPNGKNPRTISVWLNPQIVPGDFSLTALAWGQKNTGQANMIGLGRNAIISYQAWVDDAPVNFNYELGKWINVTTTYDGTTAQVYVNGVRLTQVQKTSWNSSGTELFIGTRISGDLGYFQGFLDDIRIYNRVLSNDEIVKLYSTELGREL